MNLENPIFIVDGDEIAALSLASYLQKNGYKVFIKTKDTVFLALKRQKYSILIVDFETSGLSTDLLYEYIDERKINAKLVVLNNTSVPSYARSYTKFVNKFLGWSSLHESLKELCTNTPLYDLSFLKEAAGENDVFISKMLTIFKKNVAEKTNLMEGFLQSKNVEEIKKVVHQLKPSINQLKIDALNDIIHQIEKEELSYNLFSIRVGEFITILRQVATFL